ncbi:uncharacterized protein LOC106523692 [Austrofundulus limnaeus]|uniref:Uncharacterized protein LOC106523692 n=1 Tax=Austrofundulus limnaeus TaxID=52670 RepID=A0A2I4BY43_AUSLI|nr:PREDICTED: uncharacterized protein LOC106523692 [Austrofundulus limnaeus]
MFEYRVVHKCTWHQAILGQRSMITFVIESLDLKLYVLDTLVKRGAELSTDHHLVVSWIRWQGRLPDRPGKPKRIVRVKWEHLAEPPCLFDLQLPPPGSFFYISQGSSGTWNPKGSCSGPPLQMQLPGLKVIGACCDGNQRTCWWTPVVMEAIRLKEEAFRTWLSRKTPEAADRYRVAKTVAASVVADAKTWAWEEFGEAIEKDFRLTLRRFWQTFQRLRKAKRSLSQAVFGLGGELLTRTEDIVGQWKEHFEDLLNPSFMSTFDESESEDSGEDESITMAEVTKVVKKLLGGRAPGVEEIRPEMLKVLDVVGLSWLTHLFNIAWRTGTTPVEWQTRVVVPIFKKGTGECVLTIVESHFLPSLGKFTPGCWKGGYNKLLNLGFRRSSVAFVLGMKQGTRSLSLQSC